MVGLHSLNDGSGEVLVIALRGAEDDPHHRMVVVAHGAHDGKLLITAHRTMHTSLMLITEQCIQV